MTSYDLWRVCIECTFLTNGWFIIHAVKWVLNTSETSSTYSVCNKKDEWCLHLLMLYKWSQKFSALEITYHFPFCHQKSHFSDHGNSKDLQGQHSSCSDSYGGLTWTLIIMGYWVTTVLVIIMCPLKPGSQYRVLEILTNSEIRLYCTHRVNLFTLAKS